ncbi:hypothetical protein A1F96_08146 [Pyrenophora tritici-repentis]|uniref:Cytochrome p450 monooxygenase n=2 Tax=Pyrenophora tritici-repentis TaxID=45151 RepID=A0A922SZ74_9PLEO|nr:Cytochrome p450 monooxygenase [Pyrenophora tritici-repentis]KAI1665526.1 Cytochrome p450 monooxygenase [Pyrenophora tritici-repentis]KAI1677642.1 Cytochrome p450 monooxygenase [Pyrenophora tritici-repentis]PZD25786.1 hypothetical protein A1F96_08146 [Pyrenophora tritici-repentis]
MAIEEDVRRLLDDFGFSAEFMIMQYNPFNGHNLGKQLWAILPTTEDAQRSTEEVDGPLVRISPNEVFINDNSASSTIYARSNEPWVKARYHCKAFQSSTAYSIFTELDPVVHAKHLKLLNPSFSHAKIAKSQSLLYSYSTKLIEQMRIWTQAHEGGVGAIGLSDAFRGFALDVVTDWTFGQSTKCMKTFDATIRVDGSSTILARWIAYLQIFSKGTLPCIGQK